MEISPYEGEQTVDIGNGGIVVLRRSIPGLVRERAEGLRTKIRASAKQPSVGGVISAQDISMETELDEAAYNLALAEAYLVSWNLTRHGMPIPLTPDEVKRESLAGLPDAVYKPLIAAVLKQASGRTDQEQADFRGGGGPLGA